ncbi:MAG: phosphatase PAP2 family protein [Roseiarcus sp.]|jgi:membrane-associated PAP2 superfamily phosphatase
MPRSLLVLLGLTILTLVVFALWPGIDLAVSHFFYDRGGFSGHDGLERFGRDFFRVTPYATLIGFAILYALRRFGVAVPHAPTGRALVFLAATMAIGPGLIVNSGLKSHSHRPRPAHVQEFGGTEEFRPWYRFDGACEKNCAFASGEAASGFWMVAPASLAPPPVRGVAMAAAIAFGAAASLLRIAFGGHFLSDVLVGGLISLIVIVLARWLIWPRGGAP